MRLRFTREALIELRTLLDGIAVHSPGGTTRVRARLQVVARVIGEQPFAGRVADDGRTRRFDATPFPVAVFYEISRREVVVVAVRHAARDPVTMPGR